MLASIGRVYERAVYLITVTSAVLAVVVAIVRPDGALGGML